MEPENITQTRNSGKKKFLIISLVAVLIIAVVIGYLFIPKDTLWPTAETTTVVQEKKIYTQDEKMRILANLAESAPKDTLSQDEKLRILQNLSKKAPTDTLSDAEKLRKLRALEASINQIN
ncbi:MAG: hypothetical protein HZB10_03000 [Candidatus Yonathbacteria bacterium]|nr:hypothetical protein [Candidatus Yonathbacteria bacterium]